MMSLNKCAMRLVRYAGQQRLIAIGRDNPDGLLDIIDVDAALYDYLLEHPENPELEDDFDEHDMYELRDEMNHILF